MNERLLDDCYGAALLLASISARVEVLEGRGEKPPVGWEDSKACVRGIIAAGLAGALVPELVERLCVIASACGVSDPADFFS